MCLPALIPAMASMSATAVASTQLAIATLGQMYGMYQQGQNARLQRQYEQEQYERTAENATASAVNQYNALLMRQRQEEAAASQAISESAMRAAQAASTARVTAGEAGTAGLSVDALLSDYKRQELGFAQTTIRNQVWQNAQIALSMKGIQAQQQAQMTAAMPRPVARPDYVGALLRIGEAGLASVGTYYDITKAQGGKLISDAVSANNYSSMIASTPYTYNWGRIL